MRITKHGHACVRLSHAGVTLVVDPGGWTSAEAVSGVDGVLITHEHPDHYDPDHLRAAGVPIFTIAAVAAQIASSAPALSDLVSVVSPGSSFTVGDFSVSVVGEQHAVIHPDLPRFDNSGYLVSAGGTSLFHPGDALTAPGRPVDVLCAPVSAPWLKVSEAVDFARSVGAPRNLAIHDRVYSPEGLAIVDGHFDRLLPSSQSYVRLAEGADLS